MAERPHLAPAAAAQEAREALLQTIRNERAEYALPTALRAISERFAADVLALLFPHFLDCRPCDRDPADELDELQRLLGEAREPGAAPGLVEGFFGELSGIRDALLRDAQALYDFDPAAHSIDQ